MRYVYNRLSSLLLLIMLLGSNAIAGSLDVLGNKKITVPESCLRHLFKHTNTCQT